MIRRRWSGTNPVSAEAMKSVQIVKVEISSVSAKVRAAGIGGLEKGHLGAEGKSDVWTGVLPVWEQIGEEIESEFNDGRDLQLNIKYWRDERNRAGKAYSEKSARS